MIDARGKLFGWINIFDGLIGLAVILMVLGIFVVQSGYYVTSGQVVQGESDIQIAVQIPSLKTLDNAMFKPGEKTAITIRNQPRGEVLIDKVTRQPVKMTALLPNGKPSLVDDLAMANSYDFLLTLRDHAKITEDGYVTEGVKVKVGLPIELEGFKYRVYGKIIDVQPVK